MNSKKRISLKARIISLIAVILLIGVDQVIKYYVELYLKDSSAVVLLKNVLQLNYLQNDGAMMGFLDGKTTLMSVLAVICVVVMLGVIFSGIIKDPVDFTCSVLMIAGGFGNIIDRIFRGYVVDYIEVLFVDFYIFNFADCLITVSAFVLIFYQIYLIINENKKEKAGGCN